ncbi:MAG: 4Fe-4S dicluster domain-containing protein [Halobacteriota archaeon]|nr:4Fe-4S dicluster domain-containing protein [Halobacteriota archaeon]
MKLFLRFSPEIIKNPIIAEIILETGAMLNINKANVTPDSGEIVADVTRDKVDEVMRSFKERGVEVTVLKHPVTRDDERCVNCGACISICPVDVFQFREDWGVDSDDDKCIRCGVCVYGCPLGALCLGEDGM